MNQRARLILLVLLYFGAVSAFCGGLLGVVFGGAGVPSEYLVGTPFASYLIPGLILGIVVGGTQLLAALTLQRRSRLGLLATSVAGFGMMIWNFVELSIIGYSWLQSLYFGLGLGEVLIVLLCLGVMNPGPGTRSTGSSEAVTGPDEATSTGLPA